MKGGVGDGPDVEDARSVGWSHPFCSSRPGFLGLGLRGRGQVRERDAGVRAGVRVRGAEAREIVDGLLLKRLRAGRVAVLVRDPPGRWRGACESALAGFFRRGAGDLGAALERVARALGGAAFDDLRIGFGSSVLSSLIFLDLVESAAAGPEFRKLDAPGQLCLVIITLSLDADLGHGNLAISTIPIEEKAWWGQGGEGGNGISSTCVKKHGSSLSGLVASHVAGD